MDQSLTEIIRPFAGLAALAAFFGGIAVWGVALRRKSRGIAAVAFEPRRPAPWSGVDVLALLAAYFLIASLALFSAERLLGWDFNPNRIEAGEAPHVESPESAAAGHEPIELDRAHPIVVLLAKRPGIGTFLLCLATVVVMAPIAEEFFFRLVLQGWFERIDLRFRRLFRYSGRLVGTGPVLVSSLLFAVLHARDVEAPPEADYLMRMLFIDMVVKGVLLVFGVFYLRRVRGATLEDLGLKLDKLPHDAGLALASFAALFVPIYAIQWGLNALLPDSVTDPAPLFLFALGLGYLYFRTHRIVPAILLHMIFNAAALVVFFATVAPK